MPRVRVLQITHQYPPDHIGGVEWVTQSLARELAARGHDSHVLTRAPGPDASQVEDGVVVHRVSAPASPAERFRASFGDSRALDAAMSVLESAHPDIAHVQHLMGWPVALIDELRKRRVPFIVTLHDYWFACANAQLITNFDETLCAGPSAMKCGRCAAARAGMPAPLQIPAALTVSPLMARRNAMLRRALEAAAQVTAPSRFVVDWFGSRSFDTSGWRVVELGLDKPADFARASNNDSAMRVAFIGGLAAQKGAHVLVQAFNRQNAKATLTMAGDEGQFPEYVMKLRALSSHPGIRFVGSLSRAQVWDLLASSDVVVVPSLWHETASLIAREALAAGCFVIGTRVGALRELLEANPNAALVPPNDIDALAAALTNADATSSARNITPQPTRSQADYARDMVSLCEQALG